MPSEPNGHPLLSAGNARRACVAGLVAVLTLGSPLVTASRAYAASAQTESSLSQLKAKVDTAADDFAEANERAGKLNAQVDELAEQILELEQDQLPQQRAQASEAARGLYKAQEGSASIIAKLLTVTSVSDFISMNKYLGSIQDERVAALDELNDLKNELNQKMQTLSDAKDKAHAEQQRASKALASAQSAADEMQRKADAENAAEAKAAAEAAAKAKALKQQADKGSGSQTDGSGSHASGNGGSHSSGHTGNQGSSSSGSNQSANQDSSSNQGSGSSSTQGGGSTSSGWLSGRATHYGIGDGFLGGTTASGATVTETSMGVAMLNVPLGTRVEIRYRGVSVIAVVNDRGPYGAGLVIDMQPAVARALNFVEVGVDTVQYRFL